MLNLIKMDIYRLLHAVSTWVMMGIMVLIAVVCVGATRADLNAMAEDPAYTEQAVSTAEDEVVYGIVMDTDPEWIHGEVPASQMLGLLLNSGILMIFCAIFVSLFVGAEHRSGYLKNIAGQLPYRGQLALSKFIAIAVEVLLMFAIYTVFCIASGYIFFGDQFTLGSVAGLFKMLGTQYLLHLGFSALIMFLCMVTGSTAFGMGVGILGCSGLTSLLYSGINWVIQKIHSGVNFDFGRYMLDTNVYAISGASAANDILRAVLVACVFAVLAVGFSALVMQKRDIK